MKKIILSSILSATLFMFCIECKSQFAFSVSPGLQFNSAGFGYKINKFVPYFGLQVLNGSANMSEKGEQYDWNTNAIVSYEDEYNYSGTIYMPTLGAKYFFKETNKIKAYATMSFTKFLLSGKIEDENDAEANEEIKDMIRNTSLFGGQIGFGTEYFFDDNFSIGGEFGFRLLHLKYKDEIEDEIYNPNTGDYVPSTTTYDYRFNLNPTYMKLSLNYYFSK